MVDSGDAALFGAVGAGAVTYVLTDGNKRAAVFGAGAGLVVIGEGADQLVGE